MKCSGEAEVCAPIGTGDSASVRRSQCTESTGPNGSAVVILSAE